MSDETETSTTVNVDAPEEVQELVKSPLDVPEILEGILNFCPVKTLKTARLVSTKWGAVGSIPLLTSKGYVVFKQNEPHALDLYIQELQKPDTTFNHQNFEFQAYVQDKITGTAQQFSIPFANWIDMTGPEPGQLQVRHCRLYDRNPSPFVHTLSLGQFLVRNQTSLEGLDIRSNCNFLVTPHYQVGPLTLPRLREFTWYFFGPIPETSTSNDPMMMARSPLQVPSVQSLLKAILLGSPRTLVKLDLWMMTHGPRPPNQVLPNLLDEIPVPLGWNLRHLAIHSGHKITLTSLRLRVPYLQVLELLGGKIEVVSPSTSTGLKDEESLVQPHPRLRTFITGHLDLDEGGIRILARSFRALRILNIGAITNLELCHICTYFHDLEALEFGANGPKFNPKTGITGIQMDWKYEPDIILAISSGEAEAEEEETQIKMIPRKPYIGNLPVLRRLTLWVPVSDGCVYFGICECPNLESLRIYMSAQLTDFSMKCISEKLKKLQDIRFGGSSKNQLTDVTFHHQLYQFSHDVLETFKEKLPNCRIYWEWDGA